MKDQIIKFLKSKFNISLLVSQLIAILFFAIGNAWNFAYILAFMSEGVFFILLGIKMFLQNRQIRQKEALVERLPIQKGVLEHMQKANTRSVKTNKLQAVLYIIMGIILIFLPLF